ncbi:5-hydroxytryptamine receptor 4-like [Gigantopelta aegis]|uniref:5-hydroxytryptamine receptor 4-like n=1 Tax=Gigantopelta aegis TaxID=1735272 RepID=UPI001B887FC3|nr:5-hydroxytryptamine receptor 4-like [Gigantopelta aegis]
MHDVSDKKFHLISMMNDSDAYDCNAVLGALGTSRTNAYIVSLAFSDIGLAVLVLPQHIYESWNRRWGLPLWMCQLRLTVDTCMVHISVSSLCALAAEGYLAVCHPFTYAKVTTRITAVIIALCWVVPIAIWVGYEVSDRRYTGIEDILYCLFQSGRCVYLLNKYDHLLSIVMVFFIPLTVIFITYGKNICHGTEARSCDTGLARH